MVEPQEIKSRALQLAGRPGGCTITEIAEHFDSPHSRVGQLMCRMVTSGSLFRSKVSHKVVRFFDNPQSATAHESEHRVTRRKRVKKIRAEWAKSAESVIPPGIEIQRIPTPPQPLWTNTHARW